MFCDVLTDGTCCGYYLDDIEMNQKEAIMGSLYQAICKKCDNHFQIDEGGGFKFHLFRCDKCGKTKSIPYDKIKHLRDKFSANRRSKKYFEAVEQFVGKHQCKQKGSYLSDALARCPECLSTKYEFDLDGGMVLYD